MKKTICTLLIASLIMTGHTMSCQATTVENIPTVEPATIDHKDLNQKSTQREKKTDMQVKQHSVGTFSAKKIVAIAGAVAAAVGTSIALVYRARLKEREFVKKTLGCAKESTLVNDINGNQVLLEEQPINVIAEDNLAEQPVEEPKNDETITEESDVATAEDNLAEQPVEEPKNDETITEESDVAPAEEKTEDQPVEKSENNGAQETPEERTANFDARTVVDNLLNGTDGSFFDNIVRNSRSLDDPVVAENLLEAIKELQKHAETDEAAVRALNILGLYLHSLG